MAGGGPVSEDDFLDGLLPEKFDEVVEDIKIPGGYIFNDYISASYENIKFEYVDIEKNLMLKIGNESIGKLFKVLRNKIVHQDYYLDNLN